MEDTTFYIFCLLQGKITLRGHYLANTFYGPFYRKCHPNKNSSFSCFVQAYITIPVFCIFSTQVNYFHQKSNAIYYHTTLDVMQKKNAQESGSLDSFCHQVMALSSHGSQFLRKSCLFTLCIVLTSPCFLTTPIQLLLPSQHWNFSH